MQSYIRVGDLQSLSYAAGEDAKIAGGDTVEQLEVCCPELHVHRECHLKGAVNMKVRVLCRLSSKKPGTTTTRRGRSRLW